MDTIVSTPSIDCCIIITIVTVYLELQFYLFLFLTITNLLRYDITHTWLISIQQVFRSDDKFWNSYY